jgi:hypothetical protein
MKISRSAGVLLKPHLGVLIPALLVNKIGIFFSVILTLKFEKVRAF